MSKVLEALVSIQADLKAPKDQNAGRYRYRNIEDINEAVKPLAASNGCAVVYTDEFFGGMCVSTCRLIGEDGEITANGVSYVNREPKNMSVEQASGAASSYARKYAACGLFAIDSSENDTDKVNAQKPKDDAKPAKQGRFAKVNKLKAEALSLGIKEEGIKSWIETTFNGKPMRDFDDREVKLVEGYLATLINDKHELNGGNR